LLIYDNFVMHHWQCYSSIALAVHFVDGIAEPVAAGLQRLTLLCLHSKARDAHKMLNGRY